MSDNKSAACGRETSGWLLPALVSGLLHGAAVLVLWGGWWQESPANTSSSRLQTQLMTLTYEVAEPELPVEVIAAEPPAVEPLPVVEPEPVLDQALIARQRLQEQQQREQQEREQQKREQQEKEQQERERLVQEEQRQQKIRAEQLANEKLAEEQLAEEKRQQQQRQQAQQRLAAEAAAIAQYQPINKTPPTYPRRALDSKIEGDCTVSYTVTSDGRVSKPAVIEDACDDQIFIRPSLQAASAFRYQPRVINGRAVAVHDVRNTFRYRIQP